MKRPVSTVGSSKGSRILRLTRAMDVVISFVCQLMILLTTTVLLALLTVNVAARYIFQEGGIAWISEVPAQLFPWLIASGVVMATLRGGHIAVDFAYSILGERSGQLVIPPQTRCIQK